MNRSPIADFIAKYITEVTDLMSVIVSDDNGVHIFSSFD